MEKQSRKRPEASPSEESTSRSSKRTGPSAATDGAPAPTSAPVTRSPCAQNPLPPPPPPPASASAPMGSTSEPSGRRRGGSSRSQPCAGRPVVGKGKEQVPAERLRSRDRDWEDERVLGLGFDGAASGAPGVENDTDAALSILQQNLSSARTALQGLLGKVGVGLNDLHRSSALSATSSSSQQSGRLKTILSVLRVEGEEGRRVEALTQLCELLSIGTEDLLRSFSIDAFVPVLVGLLNHESSPDIMLLAARALTHLCDVLPSSCVAVVRHNAIPCLCARLLTIEHTDLAEQVLRYGNNLIPSLPYAFG